MFDRYRSHRERERETDRRREAEYETENGSVANTEVGINVEGRKEEKKNKGRDDKRDACGKVA